MRSGFISDKVGAAAFASIAAMLVFNLHVLIDSAPVLVEPVAHGAALSAATGQPASA